MGLIFNSKPKTFACFCIFNETDEITADKKQTRGKMFAVATEFVTFLNWFFNTSYCKIDEFELGFGLWIAFSLALGIKTFVFRSSNDVPDGAGGYQSPLSKKVGKMGGIPTPLAGVVQSPNR